MAKHTPTPWTHFKKNGVTAIMDADRHEIVQWNGFDGSYFSEVKDPNAAFIVRACNTHDDLVAALKYLLEREQIDGDGEPTLARAREMARAALAKAES